MSAESRMRLIEDGKKVQLEQYKRGRYVVVSTTNNPAIIEYVKRGLAGAPQELPKDLLGEMTSSDTNKLNTKT